MNRLYELHFIWTASSEFGTYRLCEQRRFRRACASAQSRQNLRCSLIQAVSQEEPSDRKPDPWPLWMAGHAQLKCVMTECSKTQIRLTGLILYVMLYNVLLWKKYYCLILHSFWLIEKTNNTKAKDSSRYILHVIVITISYCTTFLFLSYSV